MTDESAVYPKIGERVRRPRDRQHSIEEYVPGGFWHTNTVESFLDPETRRDRRLSPRLCQAHLNRYLSEFDFRRNERSGFGVRTSADHQGDQRRGREAASGPGNSFARAA